MNRQMSLERERPERRVYCSHPTCRNLSTCECGQCRKRYCDQHTYNVTHTGSVLRGIVCETCRDMRLSRYTGVLPGHFVKRGES